MALRFFQIESNPVKIDIKCQSMANLTITNKIKGDLNLMRTKHDRI